MAAKSRDKTFRNALAEPWNVKAACGLARISEAAVYKKRREGADFARRWFEALAEGYDNLEMDLLSRLREGRLEDVDDDGTKRKFDIGTAFRCLIAHRETVNREKNRKTLADDVVTLKSINAKIDEHRAKEEHAAELQAKRMRAKSDDR